MRKIVNKSIAWILVMLLVIGVCPVSYATESDDQEIVSEELPWDGVLIEAQTTFDIASEYTRIVYVNADDSAALQQEINNAAFYQLPENGGEKTQIVLKGNVQLHVDIISGMGDELIIYDPVDFALVSDSSVPRIISTLMNKRHFIVLADASIIFKNVDLVGKRLDSPPGNGGGIDNTAGKKLTLTDANINNCRFEDGAAIYSKGNGEVTLNNCIITDNEVITTNGGAVKVEGNGGANAKLTINGDSSLKSIISNNLGTTGTYAAVFVSGSNAIFEMNGGQIQNNTSSVASGSVYLADGAKMFIDEGAQVTGEKTGAGIYADNGRVELYYGQVSGNKLNGIYSKNNTVLINGANAKVSNNTGDGVVAKTIEFGPQGEISGNTVNGISFYTNGGRLTMTGGSIKNHNNGAGVYADKADLFVDISGGEISNNKNHGINMLGDSNVNYLGTLKISGTADIKNNSAVNGAGIYQKLGNLNIIGGTINNNAATGNGGGVFVDNGVTTTISAGTITTNTATGNGAGVFVEGTNTISQFTLSGTGSITNNTTTAGNGGGIYFNGYPTRTSELKINGGSVTLNKAVNGAGIYAASPDSDGTADSKVTITAGNVNGNIATGNGGGIYVNGKLPVIMSGGQINSNKAVNGGGIYTNAVGNRSGLINCITLSGTGTISDNTASANGGGVHFASSQGAMVINSDTTGTLAIAGNTAAQNGGGIYIAGSRLENYINLDFKSGTMSGNKATSGRGGAISVENVSRIKVAAAAAFGSNLASVLYDWDITDVVYKKAGNKLLHDELIKTTAFTGENNNAYNNYDIGYTRATLTYDPGSGSGSKRMLTVGPGDTVVLDELDGFRANPGYKFKNWNTQQDGQGTAYKYKADYIMESNAVTLWAIWETYASGGSGGSPATPKPPAPEKERTILRIDAICNGQIIYQEIWSAEEGKILTHLAPELTGYTLDDDYSQRTLQIVEGLNKITFEYKKIAPLALEMKDHVRYINGYPDGTILPDDNITRAEAAAIFYRLLEAKDKGTVAGGSFHDVASGAWYAEAVNYLAANGIVGGYPDGNFRPNAPITRAEFTAIATRFDELGDIDTSMFKDVASNDWAAKYINSAASKGWVSGFPDGTFKPNDNVTRVQVVVIVNKMLNRSILFADIPETVEKFTDLTSFHWGYADMCEAINEHEQERKGDGTEDWIQ